MPLSLQLAVIEKVVDKKLVDEPVGCRTNGLSDQWAVEK